MKDTNEQFLELLVGMRPEQVLGLAKLWDIKILTENVDPETKTAIARPAEEIVGDIVDHYAGLGRVGRRICVRQLRKSLAHDAKESGTSGTTT